MGNELIDRRTLITRAVGISSIAAITLIAWQCYPPASSQLSNEARRQLLAAVSDVIIPRTDTPGALDARVPERTIDLLDRWASAKTRIGIDGALLRIDKHARQRFGAGFVALGAKERTSSLTEYDLLALQEASNVGGAAGAEYRQAAVADPEYLQLKRILLKLYYYSKEAAESELIYEHVPGQWQASLTVSPDFRPWLGNGRN